MDDPLFRVKQTTIEMARARGYDVIYEFEGSTYYREKRHLTYPAVDEPRLLIENGDIRLLLPEEDVDVPGTISIPYYFHRYFNRKDTSEPLKFTVGSLSELYIRKTENGVDALLVYFGEGAQGKAEIGALTTFQKEIEKYVDSMRVIAIAEKNFSASASQILQHLHPRYLGNVTIKTKTIFYEAYVYSDLYVCAPFHSRAPKFLKILNNAQRQKLASIGFTSRKIIQRIYEDPFYRFYGVGSGDIVKVKVPVVVDNSMIQTQIIYVHITEPAS